jgi:YVTN family beta-propeller protein
MMNDMPFFATRSVLVRLALPLCAATVISGLTVPPGAAASAGAVNSGAFPTAYVTNEYGFSLVPIDSRTGTVGKPVKFSSFANIWGLGIAPDGATAYVADYGGGSDLLYPVNLTTSKVGTPITVGGNPGDVAITPDGTTAYVPISPDALPPFKGYVVPVDLHTNTAGTPIPVGLDPMAIAITPNGQTAYVVNGGSNSVTPVDIATGTAGKPIPVGTAPDGIAITPNGSMAYVTDSGGPSFTKFGKVTPINLATNKPEKPITVVGGYPVGIAITANGSTAYVVNNFASTVTPISLATRRTARPIKVGAGAFEIAVSPRGGTAYVTDANDNTVTPVNLARGKPERPIKVGHAPVDVQFAPGWYQQASLSARSRRAPALTVFHGAMYAAFAEGGGAVGYQHMRATGWSATRTVSGGWGRADTTMAPALAVFGGRLYAFWTAGTGGRIRYSAFNGASWSRPGTVGGSWGRAVSVAGPAATTAGRSLYAAWTTRSGSVRYAAFGGTSWAKQVTAVKNATSDAPAITGIAGGPNAPRGAAAVVFAWTRPTGGVGYGKLSFTGFSLLGTVPQAASDTAPALGYAGSMTGASADGTLYLAWKRKGRAAIAYKAIFHVADTVLAPGSWTPLATQPEAMTGASPAIAADGFVIYLAWSRRGTDRIEYSSALNPY